MNIENVKIEVKNIQNLFLTKNYNLIIEVSKKAIRKYPKYSIFYNLLGLALNNLGKFSEAISVLLEGYKVNQKDLAIINNLANAYKNIYEYKNAENFYKQAIKLDQNYFNAYINYGNLKRELNLFKEANEQYLKALNINENDPMVNYALAMSYQSLGDFKKCEYYAKETLRLQPKFTKADLLISRSKKYKNEDTHLNEMINKLKNSNLDDQQKMELYFSIGKAFEDLNEISKSVEYLRKGNKIKNDFVKYNLKDEEAKFKNIKEIYLKIDKKKISTNFNKNLKKIIFILGMPRSGTTLVEQIISAHPDVYGSGELPYLSKIIQNEFIEVKKINAEKITSTIYDENEIKKISKRYLSYLEEYKINETYITDKAPLNFYWIGYIKIFFPNSKIIHCSRNAKDNCLSLYKNFFEGKLDFCYSDHKLNSFFKLYKDIINFWN